MDPGHSAKYREKGVSWGGQDSISTGPFYSWSLRQGQHTQPLGGGPDKGDTADPPGCRTHDRRGGAGTMGSRSQLHRQKDQPRAMAPQCRNVLKAKVVSSPWLGVIKQRPARSAVGAPSGGAGEQNKPHL